MIIISHRGNLAGANPKVENKRSYLEYAINEGFQVECDVWYEKGWWLGHDEPKYKVSLNWLKYTPSLWIHCKNVEALDKFSLMHLNGFAPHYFWHQNDSYTLTSHGIIWAYPRKPLSSMSICVMPELGNYTFKQLRVAAGICTNRPLEYAKDLGIKR